MKTSLYFHIPFCTKKCPYCHFYVIPNRPAYQQLLGECIALEWELRRPQLEGKSITSIYFGGGTPSLFGGIADILEPIPKDSDCEITIEANPEQNSFSEFIDMGINRLSIGVQSLDDSSLQTLERVHSAAKAKKAIWEAHNAGFKNISIDLMYDLPGQTEESWLYTLDQIADLPIQHISLYNLTIEPHTAFHKRKVQKPKGELSLRFLMAALEKFEQLGLKRYEISAFALPGFESRHNVGYWTARPFLGFGPSAFSYWDQERFRNVANIHRYARHLKEKALPVDFREKLPYPANVKELFTVQLRLKSGVRIDPILQETQAALTKLIHQDLVLQTGNHFQLTEKGMLYYDTVASELI